MSYFESKSLKIILNLIKTEIKKLSNNVLNNNTILLNILKIINKNFKSYFEKDLLRKYIYQSKTFAGVSFKISDKDKKKINYILNNKNTLHSFRNMKSSNRNFFVKEIINKKNIKVDELKNKLEKKIKNSFKTIIRAETTKVQMHSRKTQIEKTKKKYIYKQIGVKDNRTSKQSLVLMEKTKGWVTWSKYMSLVREIVRKYTGKNWVVDESAPIMQPNQRSIFIAKQYN